MNNQIMRTATSRISTDMRQQLLRVLDYCRKIPHYGPVFDKPVDYINIPLPDYLASVKRPMDFQYLSKQLELGEYEFLYEFLHDANLIWQNCRIYNQGDTGFLELCDYMEEQFIQQLDKCDVRVSPEVYKIIVMTNIPQQNPDTRIFSVTRTQQLVKELCDLPEPDIAECVYFLLQQKNELNLIHGSDVCLRLHNCSYDLLQKFEHMVLEKRKNVDLNKLGENIVKKRGKLKQTKKVHLKHQKK